MGSGGIASCILNFSMLGHFTQNTGGWVNNTTSLDVVVKRKKFLLCPCQESTIQSIAY
jgi:hypothetical protein